MNTVLLGRCGMPCGICPMHHIKGESKCPGCIEERHKATMCSVYKCTVSNNLEYCSECGDSPCERLTEMKEFMHLDSDKVWLRNLKAIETMGSEGFFEEYTERISLFNEAMRRFDDGRMKTFICRLFMTQSIEYLREIMLESQQIGGDDPKVSAKEFRKMAADRT